MVARGLVTARRVTRVLIPVVVAAWQVINILSDYQRRPCCCIIRLALEAQTASDDYQLVLIKCLHVTWHWYSPESLGCTPVILRLHSLLS